jgi:tetratricopeptide (TPR) repeat protein
MALKKNITSAPPKAEGEDKKLLELARQHLQKAVSLKTESPAYTFELAQAQFLAGDYQSAETTCQESWQADTSNYEGALLLAEIRLRLKKLGEAQNTAINTIQLDKQREEGWLLAARAALSLGDAENVIAALQYYLRQSRNVLIGPAIYILLAEAHLQTGAAQAALENVEQAQARLKSMFIEPGTNLLLLRARILRRLNQANLAVKCYQQILQQAGHLAGVHNELGETLMEQERFEEAFKAFQQSCQLEANNALYHRNAALAAQRAAARPDQYSKRAEAFQQQAVQLFSKVTELAPDQPRHWYELAQAQIASRNYPVARNALSQALEKVPKNAEQVPFLRLQASVSLKQGDLTAALQALWQVLSYQPKNHEVLNEMGELFYRLGRYGEAYNYFRHAEKLANDHPRYLANMSRVLLRMERLEEARALVEEAGQLDGNDYFVRHQLGAVLLEAGQHEEALEHLREAAAQEPDNVEFRYYLARAYLAHGQYSEAIHEYEEALANAPLRHRWHAELGELYLHEQIYLKALESLRLAVQIAPNQPRYFYNFSIALAANGDLQGGINALEAGMEEMNNEVGAEWHYLMGRLLLELSRLDEAQASFEKAHSLEPENPAYKLDLARTLRLKGEPIDQVRVLLEEAIEAAPQELRCFDELAYVYEANNNPEAALQALETHLKEVLETVRITGNAPLSHN